MATLHLVFQLTSTAPAGTGSSGPARRGFLPDSGETIVSDGERQW